MNQPLQLSGQPIPLTAISSVPSEQNTSGMGNGYPIPKGVAGWSWGAFFLTWIWSIGNRVWIGLIALLVPTHLIMAVVLGAKGREWAWKAKRWESVEHFNKTQREWSVAGFLLCGVLIALTIVTVIFFAYLRSSQSIKEAKQSTGTQPVIQEQNQASSDISTWKTYSNGKYHYTIDYPENWYFREVNPSWVDFSPSPIPNDGMLIDPFSIKVNFSGMNLQQELDVARNQGKMSGAKEEDVIVFGYPAKKFYNRFGTSYIFQENGNVVDIDMGQKPGATMLILNTMLSTLKFQKAVPKT